MSASATDENEDIPFDVSIDTFSQEDECYRLSNDINDEIRVTAEDCERFGIDTSRIALEKTVFLSGCGKRRPAVKLWRCSCSTENSGNFCSNCGAARPEEWVCRECGARCKGRFCANCGAQYVIVDVPQLN